MATFTSERVLTVDHWNDRLFSFSTTRSPTLRFESGQFLMLGIESDGGRRTSRAYSIASAHYQEHLEFYSVKVPGGEFTSRLRWLSAGDSLFVGTKPTGTLVLRDLRPGRRLFLFATGTGVAPFLSIVSDPETYVAFEQVYLVRGAACVSDLEYASSALRQLRKDTWLGELVRTNLHDYQTATREKFANQGRITTLLDSGKLFADLAIPSLDPSQDRAMICGNMRMLADLEILLEARGFVGSPRIGIPGDYVIERAFVESITPLTTKEPRAAVAGS